MSDIFGMAESTAFAKALASSDGLEVRQEHDDITPYTTEDGVIHIGTPSHYNFKEYIGQLHGEVSKGMKNMQFFYEYKAEKGSIQEVLRDLLQGQRSEYHQHGEYTGRDKALKENYSRNAQQAGGMTKVVDQLSGINPTVAAVLAVGNEMRNDWQGYNHVDIPAHLQAEMDRVEPILRDRWLSLETQRDLSELIGDLLKEKQEDDNDSEGQAEANPGEPALGSQGGQEGTPEDQEEGHGEHNDGQQGGSSEMDQGPGDSGEEPEGEEIDPRDEDDGEGPRDFGVGATDASISLEDLGFIKKQKGNMTRPELNDVPYIPSSEGIKEIDITQEPVPKEYSGVSSQIDEMLKGFTLSKRVRKFFLTIAQSGYDYGLTRGKLCNKNISRVYAGHPQPRIFKKRQASQIQKDSAMFLLGDCSGSMMWGEKYITSAACQIATSEVLQALGVPHHIMQFSTRGNPMHYHIKHFGERFVSRETLIHRFGNRRISMGANADGEAVVRASQILATRPEEQKILVVLSDGAPAHGKGNDEQYLTDVVKDIYESRMMQLVGIGIEDSSVERFYPEYDIVQELIDLEPVLMKLLKGKMIK